MLKLRRTNGLAKWAGRVLVVGVLAVGPVVLVSSSASASLQKCGGLKKTTETCTITGQATVNPGSLAVGAPSTIKWSTTLTGYDLNQDAKLTYAVVDATGSGSGWTLTATATPFTCTSTCKPTKHTATTATYALSFNGSSTTPKSTERPTERCATDSTCTLPSYSKVPYPVAITSSCATGVCTPTTLATASATSGLGAVKCTTDWWLNIPANAYAGTYTDTITLTASSGP
jgi:hypothetical protein